MRKSKEELAKIHREKCRQLKEIRAKMTENLGINLHQTECTYKGYCSGTCPKCKSEEALLNAALYESRMDEKTRKRRVAAAGLTAAAAITLSGCGPNTGISTYEGGETYNPEIEWETEQSAETEVTDIEGDVSYVPDGTENGTEPEEFAEE